MKTNLLFVIGTILLISCEKSDESLNQKTTLNYFPLTTGSYWVYDTYEVDSSLNETLTIENDTFTVVGDTVINGKDYKMVCGKDLNSSKKKMRYYSDSSGYIINELGNVIVQFSNFTDTNYVPIPGWAKEHAYWYYTLNSYEDVLASPYQLTENVLNYEQTIVSLVVDDFEMQLNSLYAPNIGKIRYQYGYLSELIRDNSYYEVRLTDYHIAD